MMKEFTTTVAGQTLAVKCDENLSSQANWLLKTVKEIGESNGGLKNGETIRLSWTILTVKENREQFVLHEPDFAGNPFETIVDNVNASLIVLAKQNDVLNKIGITGAPVLFSEKVVFAKDCLDKEKVYLERSSDVSDGDSGWYVGPVEADEQAKTELQAAYVYQFLRLRPELMSVFSLPPGYLTVFEGNHIDAVLNAENQNLWN